jgi:glycosyltransferase involved in cell wall biosynthesis
MAQPQHTDTHGAILLICSLFHPARGGHPARLRMLSRHLARAGAEVHVVTTPWLAGGAPARETLDGVDVQRIRDHLFVYPSWAAFRRLKREGRRFDAIVVDEPTRRHVVAAAMARRLFGCPVFFVLSGTDSETAPRWAKRAAGRMSERLICLTAYARDAFGLFPEKAVIIPPGPGNDEMASRSWPPPEARRNMVLTVARIDRRKGHDVLLRAIARVNEQLPDPPEFLFAGPDEAREYADELRALATELRLGNVRFLGAVSDERLMELYGQARLFALHTWHEMFGVVYIEAMSAGLPIVSTRCAAVPEVVRPEWGRLAPPGDPEALATSMMEILSDDALRVTMSHAARDAARVYDWPQIARRFLEIL